MNGTASVNTRCGPVTFNKSLPNSDSFGGGSNLMMRLGCIGIESSSFEHWLFQKCHSDDKNGKTDERRREMEKVRVANNGMHSDGGAKADCSGYQQNLPEAAAGLPAPG